MVPLAHAVPSGQKRLPGQAIGAGQAAPSGQMPVPGQVDIGQNPVGAASVPQLVGAYTVPLTVVLPASHFTCCRHRLVQTPPSIDPPQLLATPLPPQIWPMGQLPQL